MKFFRLHFHLIDNREIVAHVRNESLDDATEEGLDELRRLGVLSLNDHMLSFELTADEYTESVQKDWSKEPSKFDEVMTVLARRMKQ